MLKLSEQYGKWQYLESLFQIFLSEAPFLNHLAKPTVAMVENKSKEKERKKKNKTKQENSSSDTVDFLLILHVHCGLMQSITCYHIRILTLSQCWLPQSQRLEKTDNRNLYTD